MDIRVINQIENELFSLNGEIDKQTYNKSKGLNVNIDLLNSKVEELQNLISKSESMDRPTTKEKKTYQIKINELIKKLGDCKIKLAKFNLTEVNQDNIQIKKPSNVELFQRNIQETKKDLNEIAWKSKEMTKLLGSQGETLERIEKQNNENYYEIDIADTKISSLKRKQVCKLILMHSIAVLMFFTIILVLLFKLFLR